MTFKRIKWEAFIFCGIAYGIKMADTSLFERGWHLTEEGISECIENGNKTTQAIIKVALNTDLRQIGKKYLPDDINRGRVDYIEGPCILQVQKIRNVSAPKDNEESQAVPRLLKLTLTDGHNTCFGIEIETIQTVSLITPPGTKIQFSGTIPIENGFLLLNGRNTKCIGGRVEKLLQNWELKRKLAKQHRLGIISEGGPPPFMPFGHKRVKAVKTDNFKSLEIGKEKKESEEFEMQRRATIAEAVQAKEEKKTKSFGSNKQVALNDKDVAHLVEMGFATEQACQALRQNNGNVNEAIISLLSKSEGSAPRDGGSRGNANNSTSGHLKSTAKLGGEKPEKFHGRERKGRKKNEEKETGNEDVALSRPSGPATLFDFLETKIPLKDDTKSYNDRKTSDSQKDANCDGGKLNVDGYQSSDGRKVAGNRRNNLPPRLSGKSNSSSNTGQNHGNSGNYTSNNYSGGPRYNSGDGGGGNNTNNLPYTNNSLSGYGPNNSGHDSSFSDHNQQENKYNASNSSYNSTSTSINNRGVIGNKQSYSRDQQQQVPVNYHNTSSVRESGHRNGTNHDSNHVLGNNTSSHYLQSQHRYNLNNNTSVHNKHPAYQSYHGDSKQSGITHNPNIRNFPNSPGQITTSSSNYFNVNLSGQQQSQHFTNELNSTRYSNYNPKNFHPQNAGSDNPNKVFNNNYPNHHQKQQQQQQFSAPIKHPRKVLNNLNGNEGVEVTGGGGDRTGYNYNSTSCPKGGGEISGANRRRQIDIDSADYKCQDRKSDHSLNMPISSHQWHKGDHCLAKYWEDKRFYPAVIESVPDLSTCVGVTFIEYGNTEEVMLTDIKPLPKHWHEVYKPNTNFHGHQGFDYAGIMSHSGIMMPPHHTQINSHQAPLTSTAMATQQQMLVFNSPHPGEQQLMMQQSHISTIEFRRGGSVSPYAHRMQQQQQQMILMQEKIKPTQQFYMPPAQRVMKQ